MGALNPLGHQRARGRAGRGPQPAPRRQVLAPNVQPGSPCVSCGASDPSAADPGRDVCGRRGHPRGVGDWALPVGRPVLPPGNRSRGNGKNAPKERCLGSPGTGVHTGSSIGLYRVLLACKHVTGNPSGDPGVPSTWDLGVRFCHKRNGPVKGW